MNDTKIEAIRARWRRFAHKHEVVRVQNAWNDISILLDALEDSDKPCECHRQARTLHRTCDLTRPGDTWILGSLFKHADDSLTTDIIPIIGARFCPWCGHSLPEMEGKSYDGS